MEHIYTSFWIVDVEKDIEGQILISDLQDYPVPILIANFITAFSF